MFSERRAYPLAAAALVAILLLVPLRLNYLVCLSSHTPLYPAVSDTNHSLTPFNTSKNGSAALAFCPTSTAAFKRRFWLYTVVAADYRGSAALLAHWSHHYHQTLGFRKEDTVVVVHHNSTRPEAQLERQAVMAVLADLQLKHFSCSGPYSSEAHLKVRLEHLQRLVTNVHDWIMLADSDEFADFEGDTASSLLIKLEQSGANFVMGRMIDRVARNGSLTEIRPEPSLFQQFPLSCNVTRSVSQGCAWKSVAFKAYWRSNTGNHFIIKPDNAQVYFGPAKPGNKSARAGFFGAENLFNLTPFYHYSACYNRSDGWHPVQFGRHVHVMHFKWHLGVLQNAVDRYEYFKGNISQGGPPRFAYAWESRRIVMALKNHTIPLQDVQCSP